MASLAGKSEETLDERRNKCERKVQKSSVCCGNYKVMKIQPFPEEERSGLSPFLGSGCCSPFCHLLARIPYRPPFADALVYGGVGRGVGAGVRGLSIYRLRRPARMGAVENPALGQGTSSTYRWSSTHNLKLSVPVEPVPSASNAPIRMGLTMRNAIPYGFDGVWN